jgi:hypothetical protein
MSDKRKVMGDTQWNAFSERATGLAAEGLRDIMFPEPMARFTI